MWVKIQLCEEIVYLHTKGMTANRLGNSEDKVCFEKRSKSKKLKTQVSSDSNVYIHHLLLDAEVNER